jgi:magnesium transporter
MIVDCAVYEAGRRRAGDLSLHDASELSSRNDHFVWIGLHEPTEDEFDSVRREFDLHELAVEDAIHAHQRPKLEVYGESLFVVLRTARFVEEEDRAEFGEILVFLGKGFVVTVRHGAASALADVRRRAEGSPELLRAGPGAVLHAIVDRVVDDYGPVLDDLEGEIDAIEAEVFSPERTNATEGIYKLKREAIQFHRAAAPLVDPLERLTSQPFEVIDAGVRAYFRDVYDHALRASERVDALRELLTSVLDANLAQVTVQQNNDVRKISAWVAIIAAPTMIGAIYGMNFEHMPELSWTYGYPAVLLVMVAACSAIYRGFRRAGWL